MLLRANLLLSSVLIVLSEKMCLMHTSSHPCKKWEILLKNGWKATTLSALTKPWGTYPLFNMLSNMPKCPLRDGMNFGSLTIEFVDYYNTAHPHQGIDQQTPIPQVRPSSGTIQCRNVLGGIIHDYYRAPTPPALPATWVHCSFPPS